jgi:hypothetical protein
MRTLAAVIAPLILFAGPASAQLSADDSWQFSVTPYLWLPNVNGSLKFEVGNPDDNVGPNSYLSNLNAALMLNGEARKGDFGILGDFIYLKFSNEPSKVTSITGPGGIIEIPVNAAGSTDLSATLLTLAGSYSVLRNPDGYFDLLAGFRYVGVSSSLSWNFTIPPTLISREGSVSRDVDLWDGIAGARGRFNFGSSLKWFLPAYIDIGAGSSRFTMQAMIGIGYAFGWGELLLVDRYLSIEQSDDKLIQRVSFNGPAIAATFRF